MKTISVTALVLLLSRNVVADAVADPAEAAVTQAAQLVKRDASVYGWYSAGFTGGTTIWNARTVDDDIYTMHTSGSLYGFCSRTSSCRLYWGCSSGYMMYAATSSYYCGQFASTCSYNLLYSSVGATNPLTAYWCDPVGYTGLNIYAQTPGGSPVASRTPSTVSSTTRSTRGTTVISTPDTTPTPGFSTPDSPTPSSTGPSAPFQSTPVPDPQPSSSKKSNIGAIVGGVIGGIALIGAITIAAILLLRRRRNTPPPNAPMGPPTGPPAPQYTPGPPNQPMYSPPQQPMMMAGSPLPEKQPGLVHVNAPYQQPLYGSQPVYEAGGQQMMAPPPGQQSPMSQYPSPVQSPPPQSPVMQTPPGQVPQQQQQYQHQGYVNELPAQRM